MSRQANGGGSAEEYAAISIRQPWAGAIFMLWKNVENRSNWRYKHRGPLVIHASSWEYYREEMDAVLKAGRLAEAEESIIQDWDANPGRSIALSTGCILGVVELLDVYAAESQGARKSPIWDSPWRDPDAGYWLHIQPLVVFADPIPFKGRVGLFKVPAPLIDNAEVAIDYSEDGVDEE